MLLSSQKAFESRVWNRSVDWRAARLSSRRERRYLDTVDFDGNAVSEDLEELKQDIGLPNFLSRVLVFFLSTQRSLVRRTVKGLKKKSCFKF